MLALSFVALRRKRMYDGTEDQPYCLSIPDTLMIITFSWVI